MPQAILATDAYSRQLGNLVGIRLVNLFLEQSPTDDDGEVLQPRPGLTSSATRGAGPIHGIFSSPGTFAGDKFMVSNNRLYREGTDLGAIVGTGPVSWAASDDEIVLTRGTYAYSYNGTYLQPIAFPDGANVIAVAYIASLFVFIRADGHKFYWSAVLDALTVDSLDFASAELMPDDLLDVMSVLGQLVLIGQNSIEVWVPSGGVDLPFTRIDQRLYLVGARAAGCVAQLGDTVMFVGSNGKVYRLSGELQPISGPGIEERIAASTTCLTFAFSWNSHAFFCIRLDDATLVYDLSTGKWTEFATYDRDNWRAQCATNVGDTPYLGDDETGDVWVFSDVFEDDGEPLEGFGTALIPISGGTAPIINFELRCNAGNTVPLSGDDANPIMEIRYSIDAGRSFGDFKQVSLGAQGKYRTRAIIRRCGIFDPPGAVFEFRVTDRTPRRVSSAWYNEPQGGRSR